MRGTSLTRRVGSGGGGGGGCLLTSRVLDRGTCALPSSGIVRRGRGVREVGGGLGGKRSFRRERFWIPKGYFGGGVDVVIEKYIADILRA